MKKTAVFLFLAATCLPAFAHGGRTDASGCHTNHRTGDYHCHGGGHIRSAMMSPTRHESKRSGLHCSSFGSQNEAQDYFEKNHDQSLDRDGDGIACEGLVNKSSGSHNQMRSHGIYAVAGTIANPQANSVNHSSKEIVGRVIGVHDGDTLTVLDEHNEQHKIRLNAIDAPELGQAFGRNSKQMLSDVCFNHNAVVAYVDTDKYNRIVGNVSCDRVNAQEAMVSSGLAWVYDKYVGSYTYLYGLQLGAKNRKLGVWSDSNPTPPWVWRHGGEQATQSPP